MGAKAKDAEPESEDEVYESEDQGNEAVTSGRLAADEDYDEPDGEHETLDVNGTGKDAELLQV